MRKGPEQRESAGKPPGGSGRSAGFGEGREVRHKLGREVEGKHAWQKDRRGRRGHRTGSRGIRSLDPSEGRGGVAGDMAGSVYRGRETVV